MHDLLVAAGPPPALPEGLQPPALDRPQARVIVLPRRRLAVAAALAAALAAAAAFGGYAIGNGGGGFTAWRGPIPMHGSSQASASLLVGAADTAGNWPVLLRVTGLPKLPRGGYYELVLTRDGKRGPECGSFVVGGKTTVVRMNAPSSLRDWGGWSVVRHLPGRPESAPILST